MPECEVNVPAVLINIIRYQHDECFLPAVCGYVVIVVSL